MPTKPRSTPTAAAIREWLSAHVVPIPGSGPAPSAIGYQLAKLDLYAYRRADDGSAVRIRQTGRGIPCRDDGHLWRATVGTDLPDMRAVMDAALTDDDRRLVTLQTRMAASEIPSVLGVTPSRYRRMVTALNRKMQSAVTRAR